MLAFFLEIAPKNDTKNTYPSISVVTAKWTDFFRRIYAENVKKVKERACVLSE